MSIVTVSPGDNGAGLTRQMFDLATKDIDANFAEHAAEIAARVPKTVKYTIGAVGVAGCDFNFATAANTTAQPIDLGAIIPAKARVLDVYAITDTTFAGTGISAFTVTGGNSSGGTEFWTGADLITAAAIGQPAVGAGFTLTAISATAKHIYIGGAPTGGNWSALLAGKLSVYITYIDVTDL